MGVLNKAPKAGGNAVYNPRTVTASRRVLGIAIALFLLLVTWCQPQAFESTLTFVDIAKSAQPESVGTVKWWNCKGPGDVEGAECGYIIVPLDYLNTSAGTAKVALGRYKAAVRPKKGTVLFNPGGPGGAGKPVATKLGPIFQNILGVEWDFVGFDPRGIGETEPRVKCFGARGNYQLFKSNTVLERGFDVGPNLTDPRTRDHLMIQQQEAESLYKTQFELCGKSMGDALKYMGTSTVSRDIDFITTALEGKHALINFYGGSYGSILGAYLVNMFPDRLGRVVIDGIADAVAWSSKPSYKWYKQWLVNTEDAYNMFLDGCSKAGPKICALAHTKNESPFKIDRRLEDFIGGLYSKPLAVPQATRPTILTSGRARIALFQALQSPRTWPTMALAFSHAIQGNGVPLLDFVMKDITGDLERSAVSCNDNAPFAAPSPEEVVDESLDLLKNVQRHGGLAVVTTEPDSGCQFWSVTPPERFQGPWNHTLRNPILIHSNLADPVTPLSSGQLVKKLLGNSSRLAIREGAGHTSFSMSSLCTVKVTQNYFKDGTLPPDGHVCPVDESPFPDPESDRAFTGEDATMLEDLTLAGNALDRLRRGFEL